SPTKKSQTPGGIVAISFRRVPMRLATAVIATVYLLPPPSTRLLSVQALAADTTSFTRTGIPELRNQRYRAVRCGGSIRWHRVGRLASQRNACRPFRRRRAHLRTDAHFEPVRV